MRRLGIGLLGLVGGLLAGVVLQDVLSRSLVSSDSSPVILLAMGSLLPLSGAAGSVLALWLDHRQHRRNEKKKDPHE
jgi:hypothetical protein